MHHAQHDAANLAVRHALPFQRVDAFPWTAGVDVFFVISGFIMVFASRSLFAIPGARTAFLSRRLARIVPLYWAVTTLYLLIAFMAPTVLNSEVLEVWAVVASYLFIPFARSDGVVQPLYSLGWTLNYEMYFYVLFSVTVVWPARRAITGLMLTMIGLVALGWLVPLPQPLAFWTAPIILEFVFGMAIGLLCLHGVVLGRGVRTALAVSGIALLCLDFTRPGGWLILPGAFAHGLPAAALVAAAALRPEKRSGDGPGGRWAVSIGDASYALYLLHPFVIRAGSEILSRTGLAPAVGPWGFVLLALAASTAVAVLAFRWFEQPLTDRLRKWLEIRRGSAHVTLTTRA